MKYRYPCTGNVGIRGFGEYLEREIAEPRRNIRLFASELKSRFGGACHCLVNSGSSANLVAAFAAAEKLKARGMPLTAVASAFTFPTTMSALTFAGFSVRIIDVGEDDFNLDVAELERMDPVSLIVPTHFLGFPYDVGRVKTLADRWGALVLQDSCEAMDVPVFGRGNYDGADFVTWSFYHPHHLSSYGGGCVVCGTPGDFALVDSVIHWGRACKCHIDPAMCKVPRGPGHEFTYDRLGFNVEMSELNACFGRWQLARWDSFEATRKAHYDTLLGLLRGCAGLKVWERPSGGSPFVFPFRVANGMDVETVHRKLADLGVEARKLMGGVLNQQPGFWNYEAGALANARALAGSTLFLGIHQTLSDEQVRFGAEALKSVLA
ncbi:MAG: DegT/DnrJ/EryC1/StrS family aminotransferase [Kiritimatiellae bacterium]|nr:DegT/DnrJ/EryC1/StrS family aminotransferase [Kiritimatiellia bacterium]